MKRFMAGLLAVLAVVVLIVWLLRKIFTSAAATRERRREELEAAQRKNANPEEQAELDSLQEQLNLAIRVLRERDVDLLVLDLVYPVRDMPLLEQELSGVFPLMPVVQLGPEGSAPNDHDQRPQIPHDAIDASLGSTVMFTLSKVV